MDRSPHCEPEHGSIFASAFLNEGYFGEMNSLLAFLSRKPGAGISITRQAV
jgi:hypothetical protein